MSVLSAEEQELFDVAKASIPKFFFASDAAQQEVFAAAAKAFNLSRDQIKSWASFTLIGQAVGFWLDQHAIDRNMRRRSGESDAALAARVRRIDDAVTLPALQARISAILAADSVSGLGAIVELRRSCARFGKYLRGVICPAPGTISTGDYFTTTDSAGITWNWWYYNGGRLPIIPTPNTEIDVTSAVTAADVATATIAAMTASLPSGSSFSAAAGADPTKVYFLPTYGVTPGVTADFTNGPEFTGFYNDRAASIASPSTSRGFRIARYGTGVGANELIVVLPYGTPAATKLAVDGMMQHYKGGGIRYQIEVRRIP